MLKKRTMIRIKNIIISTLLASFLLNTVSYAEINSLQMNSVISKINAIEDTVINTGNLDIEEVDVSYTLKDNNWIAFYKNFIRELGGIRISYYNENGNLLVKKYVLPKQFEGSSYEYERETVYIEDTFILRDTVNKYNIDLSSFSFTDNIPCFIEKPKDNAESTFNSDNGTNSEDIVKKPFIGIDFTKWENCKTISEWLEDRSNLQNLTDELGVDFDGSDNLEVWLSKNEENCKSAGILIEPITFYPDSTEEIYCNDKTISKNYNLTHGITSSRLETEMKERGEWNWWTSIVTNVSSFLNLNSLNIYIHIGILKMDFNDTRASNLTPGAEDLIEGNSGNFGSTSHEFDADAGYESINAGTMSARFFDRNFIALTYTETTKYGRKWQKDFSIFGPTANMDEVEKETIDYSKKYTINTFLDLTGPLEDSIEKYGKLENDPNIKSENIEFYKEIGLINNKNEVMTYEEYENYYKNNEENIKKYVEKVRSDDQIVTATALWWNYRKKDELSLANAKSMYYGIKFGGIPENKLKEAGVDTNVSDEEVIEYFTNGTGYEYDSNKKVFISGMANCYIKTDHNAFSCLVLKTSDMCLASAEENLVSAGVLNPLTNERIYKYGAALIIGPGQTVATSSQILFKFHSNLDQIGGFGSIEEEYNLIGTIGSDIYISQHTGKEYKKIPRTYPDSIASSFTKEDGTNYTYKSYTTTQGLDGKAGSGKRFKVDSSKKLTQDLLDYAINKKEKENKKNLKERFEELGINTSNKLNEEEGFTEQISVNGKTYYVSEDDAERWNEEVSKYSDPDDDTTSKYTDENGNEYYIIILYVDWLYDESGNVSDDFSLYEDELSYVFDYKSIHKSDDTRKLTGTAKKGTGGG